ncbi:Uncharacterized protein APZ42_010409, partial [Daphnia magna]
DHRRKFWLGCAVLAQWLSPFPCNVVSPCSIPATSKFPCPPCSPSMRSLRSLSPS